MLNGPHYTIYRAF